MMRKWLSSLIILLVLIPTFLVFAQDSPQISLEITGANPSELPTITITTNVLDNTNIPVEGLGIDDFVIGGDLEGIATIVSVENIAADDLPFASVLVIDTSTSMQGLPLRLAKEAAMLFVQSVGDEDPIAIVTFDSDARLVQDYTTDKDALLAVIDALYVRGRTALYDAAVLGAEVAAEAPISRRAVILLSDGAEFGGESFNGRSAGLEQALEDGVSMYTIGLGFGTDRSYLEQLSSGSNARNYESPSPAELASIYAELAALFRTQYIVTAESNIPLDGTEYEFSLQATTADGDSNVDTGNIRAPIPTPIVELDDNLFSVPFSSAVEITLDVQADDEIAGILISIDDEAIEHENGTFTIDPLNYPPGSYDLAVTVTDVDGDSGSDSVAFETAALAPDVTLDFSEGTIISEPTTITINVDGQTPAVSATYSVLLDGVSVASETSTDAENSFPFTIDPFDYAVGDYELFIGVENEGGASANLELPFEIDSVAPQNLSIEGIEDNTRIDEVTSFTIAADTQPGADLSDTSVTVDGEALDTLEIRPGTYQPGPLELEVTVIDSNGESVTQALSVEIASLPPQISFGDVPDPVTENILIDVIVDSQTELISVSYNFGDALDIPLEVNSDGTYPSIPINIDVLQQEEVTVVIEATNAGGSTASETLNLNIILPTPTPDMAGTTSAVIAMETSDAVATVNVQSTLEANSTVEAQGTNDAQSTVDAEEEANAQATLDTQSTVDAEEEANAQATLDTQLTVDAEEEANAQATVDAQNAVEETEEVAGNVDATEEESTDTATEEPATEEESTDEVAAAANVDATTESATEAPDVEPTSTNPDPTVEATLTPVELVDLGAQSAEDNPTEGNLTGLLVAIGAILLVVVLLFILWFGRGNNKDDRER